MARFRRRRSRGGGRGFVGRIFGGRMKPMKMILIGVALYLFVTPVRNMVQGLFNKK